jgi:hypothetical protein
MVFMAILTPECANPKITLPANKNETVVFINKPNRFIVEIRKKATINFLVLNFLMTDATRKPEINPPIPYAVSAIPKARLPALTVSVTYGGKTTLYKLVTTTGITETIPNIKINRLFLRYIIPSLNILVKLSPARLFCIVDLCLMLKIIILLNEKRMIYKVRSVSNLEILSKYPALRPLTNIPACKLISPSEFPLIKCSLGRISWIKLLLDVTYTVHPMPLTQANIYISVTENPPKKKAAAIIPIAITLIIDDIYITFLLSNLSIIEPTNNEEINPAKTLNVTIKPIYLGEFVDASICQLVPVVKSPIPKHDKISDKKKLLNFLSFRTVRNILGHSLAFLIIIRYTR